jgi:hypothetical protein
MAILTTQNSPLVGTNYERKANVTTHFLKMELAPTLLLMALPYQGLMNQLNCQIRAMSLADMLNITYVQVPVVQSVGGTEVFFDLRNYLKVKARKFIDWKDVSGYGEVLLHGRWKHASMLGKHSASFVDVLQLMGLRLRWVKTSMTPYDNPRRFMEIIQGSTGLLVLSNLQHVSFGYIAHARWKNLGLTAYLRRVYSREMWRMAKYNEFTSIHWRRGDFARACLKNKDMLKCWPHHDVIRKSSRFKSLILCTNSDDAEELLEITNSNPGLVVFKKQHDPVVQLLLDFNSMLQATQFLGNQYSTISRNANVMRDFMNKTTDYF